MSDEYEPKIPAWRSIITLPLIFIFASMHFLLCSALTIFVHPRERRKKIYEYYAPWGWGK